MLIHLYMSLYHCTVVYKNKDIYTPIKTSKMLYYCTVGKNYVDTLLYIAYINKFGINMFNQILNMTYNNNIS